MSEYNENKIRRLDLTVLLIFLALMRTRKASDVAGELGLTNSSISHTLRRLREVFEDELFLRRPHGLEPTAFAIQIEPSIRAAVDAVQSALSGPALFNPATADITLRLSASDREIATFLPKAMANMREEAPGIHLSVRSLTRSECLRGLSDGTLDLALGYFAGAGDEFDTHLIRKEGYLVAARKGHAIFDAPLTPETYAAEAHILVSSDGSMRGVVDTTLEQQGLNRQVCLAVPSFLPALSVLAESDFISTLPADLVRHHASYFGLKFCEPPIEIRSFDVSILRHKRHSKSAVHNWVTDKLAK
ncbi:LysR family transcriptional regulator [Cognatiyoonia sp. IB215446]|uniref:LysR family transcriptional regulator n=1 Tax=Cognatiyoonia sp. IB215446 TaxID=3097355 RepID=UPI002A0B8549|nr:LysR family transcriptional regulator [Cognatiyoonia sp. IB215446]MDX8346975.1 LysR family transcriptional regulator [Cognatiyoonia sp. IB215446]